MTTVISNYKKSKEDAVLDYIRNSVIFKSWISSLPTDIKERDIKKNLEFTLKYDEPISKREVWKKDIVEKGTFYREYELPPIMNNEPRYYIHEEFETYIEDGKEKRRKVFVRGRE